MRIGGERSMNKNKSNQLQFDEPDRLQEPSSESKHKNNQNDHSKNTL
jgi:hypothetical protein